jgi:hypothetical protein
MGGTSCRQMSARQIELRRATHELNEVFTVIGHYADACGHFARAESDLDCKRIEEWGACIAEQIDRAIAVVKQLVEAVDHET